jgi:hypothetical protein
MVDDGGQRRPCPPALRSRSARARPNVENDQLKPQKGPFVRLRSAWPPPLGMGSRSVRLGDGAACVALDRCPPSLDCEQARGKEASLEVRSASPHMAVVVVSTSASGVAPYTARGAGQCLHARAGGRINGSVRGIWGGGQLGGARLGREAEEQHGEGQAENAD